MISGGYTFQKGIYTYCWAEKELKPYITKVSAQLFEFTSLFNFADVKYDNIPLTKEGKVALIDLDRQGAVTGLTKACAGKNDGLFNYLPVNQIEQFLAIAKSHLDIEQLSKVENRLIHIKDRVVKKEKTRKDYAQFLQNKGIQGSSQTFNPHLPVIFTDSRKQQLAVAVVEAMNARLQTSRHFSLNTGRDFLLRINMNDPLTTEARRIWQKDFVYDTFTGNTNAFTKTLADVLEGLKNAGYIYKYKIVKHYHYVRIAC